MPTFLTQLLLPQAILLAVFAYALGAVPFGLILVRKFRAKDIREAGSGNIGATNVARIAGKRLGTITLVLDAMKGAIPVLIASSLQLSLETQCFVGLCAFLGHCFPVWLKFSGGKGVATSFGMMVAFSPWLALVGLVIFTAAYIVLRNVGFSSLFGALAVIIAMFFIIDNSTCQFIIAVVIFILVMRHADNIRELLHHEED